MAGEISMPTETTVTLQAKFFILAENLASLTIGEGLVKHDGALHRQPENPGLTVVSQYRGLKRGVTEISFVSFALRDEEIEMMVRDIDDPTMYEDPYSKYVFGLASAFVAAPSEVSLTAYSATSATPIYKPEIQVKDRRRGNYWLHQAAS